MMATVGVTQQLIYFRARLATQFGNKVMDHPIAGPSCFGVLIIPGHWIERLCPERPQDKGPRSGEGAGESYQGKKDEQQRDSYQDCEEVFHVGIGAHSLRPCHKHLLRAHGAV
jgi:hypothetical protein